MNAELETLRSKFCTWLEDQAKLARDKATSIHVHRQDLTVLQATATAYAKAAKFWHNVDLDKEFQP
jgi:hypothetical protein